MKIICRPRGKGKTTTLIEKARNNKGTVVVATRSIAKDLERRFPDMTGRIVSYDSLSYTNQGLKSALLYVDDIDQLISNKLFGWWDVAAVTITGDTTMEWDS